MQRMFIRSYGAYVEHRIKLEGKSPSHKLHRAAAWAVMGMWWWCLNSPSDMPAMYDFPLLVTEAISDEVDY